MKSSVLPWWVKAVVILSAVLMAAGAVIALVNPAMLSGPNEPINGAVRIYAGYLFSRNMAVAILTAGTFIIGSRRALGTVLALTAVIQLFDAGMDLVEGRWTLVPGVLILAVLQSIAAKRTLRSGGQNAN